MLKQIWSMLMIVLTATSCTNSETIEVPSSAGEDKTAIALLPEIHFPQLKNAQSVYLEARIMGELILENDCLRVQQIDGGSILLIWDPRFSIIEEGGVIKVISSTGEVLAGVGDFVAVGGGFFDDPTVLGLEEPLPKDCPGSYYLVGETIQKIDRP